MHTRYAFALALVAALRTAALTINTPPSLVQCQPIQLQWSAAVANGNTDTVFLSILPGGQSTAAALETLPNQSGASGSYTWLVDINQGTTITIKAVDSSGNIAYSDQVTIQAGSTGCSNAGSGSGSSSVAGASSSAAAVSSAASSSASAGSTSSASANSSAGAAAAAGGSASSPATNAPTTAPTTASSTTPTSASKAPTSTGAGVARFAVPASGLLGAFGAIVALLV